MNKDRLLWKAKLMTIKMAKVRGFEIDSIDKELLNYTFEEYTDWIKKQPNKNTIKNNSVESKLSKIYFKLASNNDIQAVQIFFFASSADHGNKEVVDKFQNIVKDYFNPNIKIIGSIITDWKLSKNAMDGLKYPVMIQTFELKDFGYDFSTHAFGADYYEVVSIDRLYNIKPNQLPVMKIDNVIAKYYAWSEGTIIKMQFCNITIESIGNTCIEYFRVVK